ncbi:MAG: alpha/beta fold hydrolase [Candidatus Nanopelagicales bacterium]
MRTDPAAHLERRTLVTDDGIPLSAAHRRGPSDVAVVLAHGFSGSWRRPAVLRVVEGLAPYAGVVAVDLRGHGASGGRSTLGHLEVLDVDAALRWARLLGYPTVVTVGFSMGGSVVVRHAALHGGTDAVISVSGPAYWYYRGTPVMRRLHRAVDSRVGRAVVRTALRTRLDRPPWPDPPPIPPVEAAALLGRTPLLVVHGDQDRFFPQEHATALHTAATRAAGADVAELWWEHGFGHAEAAIPAELLDRMGLWARMRTGNNALPSPRWRAS